MGRRFFCVTERNDACFLPFSTSSIFGCVYVSSSYNDGNDIRRYFAIAGSIDAVDDTSIKSSGESNFFSNYNFL